VCGMWYRGDGGRRTWARARRSLPTGSSRRCGRMRWNCAAGIRALSLFGSVARGDAGPDSDIDLAAEFDPAARMDLIRLVGLERELAGLLGREVQILPEPVEKPRLRANVERDRVRAF